MTNKRLNALIAKGYLPCGVVSQHTPGVPRTRLTSGTTLVVIPQETLRIGADELGGFVQVINNEVVAVWESGEIHWVAPEAVL